MFLGVQALSCRSLMGKFFLMLSPKSDAVRLWRIVELFFVLSNCHKGSQKINPSWAYCPLVISIGEKSLLGHLTPGFSPFLLSY